MIIKITDRYNDDSLQKAYECDGAWVSLCDVQKGGCLIVFTFVIHWSFYCQCGFFDNQKHCNY